MPFINPYVAKSQEHPRIVTDAMALGDRRGKWSRELGGLPVWLEVGVGMGRFFRDRASRDLDRAFVGFEIRFKRLYNTASRLDPVRPQGWLLAKAMGEDVARYFAPGELDGAFVLFPDPWAKKKQRKHRLVRAQFLKDLAACVKKGGKFTFKTDHQEYFATSLAEEFSQVPEWKLTYETRDLHADAAKDAEYVHTEFEEMTVHKEKARICLAEFTRA